MGADSDSSRWITIDRFDHPTDAHIAAGRLESEGIPVFLLGIHHASINWLIATALGGIRLQVPAQYEDEARRLLAESAPDDPDDERCPRCGSIRSSAMTNDRKTAFLAVHLLGIPLPWRSSRRHCDACGHEWKETVGD